MWGWGECLRGVCASGGCGQGEQMIRGGRERYKVKKVPGAVEL